MVPLVNINHAHATGILKAHLTHRDGHVRPTATVGGNEALVVHLVDVITGEHQNGFCTACDNLSKVLQHRICRAAIPAGRVSSADLRLQNAHAANGAVQVPRATATDMVVERARVVLRQDQHVTDATVDAVRQGEVNDSILATKRHRRLCAHPREHAETIPLTARKNHRKGAISTQSRLLQAGTSECRRICRSARAKDGDGDR